MFFDQRIMLEENLTRFRYQFRPTRKKIENLITAEKVAARFVIFLTQTGRTYELYSTDSLTLIHW